jgi:hypothetical protein
MVERSPGGESALPPTAITAVGGGVLVIFGVR